MGHSVSQKAQPMLLHFRGAPRVNTHQMESSLANQPWWDVSSGDFLWSAGSPCSGFTKAQATVCPCSYLIGQNYKLSLRLCLCKELCYCRVCPKHSELAEEDAGKASADLRLNFQMTEVSGLRDGTKKPTLCVVPPVPT